MLVNELKWFLVTFSNEFRQGKLIAFQTIMLLALAHLYRMYNPKEFADYLNIPYQKLYSQLKGWSIYYLKQMLVRFMVKQASERLKPVLEKSASTKTRAGITIAIDNSVITRFGKMVRCAWSWYSGQYKKLVYGHDLLGIVITINGVVCPLHLIYCSKQGRGNTDKPSLLISMLKELKEEFNKEGIDITSFPLTLDSWFVSQSLREAFYELGFKKVVIAGKGNYVFTIEGKKQKVSLWRKAIKLVRNQWGIDVPFRRIRASNPTFGAVPLFFYEKNTTRNYYLMDFSKDPLRSAEIWHIWKQHNLIEYFWKLLKSVFHIKSMQLQEQGIYTSLLIKVVAYLLVLRLKGQKNFSKLTVVQIKRKIEKENDLESLISSHFHGHILAA